jgi:hypothetical protein
MAWTHINGGGNYAAANVSSLAYATAWTVTAGNLVVLSVDSWISALGAVTFSVSDTHNTYTAVTLNSTDYGVTSGGNSGYSSVQFFWSVVTTGGTLTVTVTPSASSQVTFAVDEYSFTPGATVTVESHNAAATATGTGQPSSGNLTFTSGDLFVAAVDNPNAETVAHGTNFTLGYSTTAGGTGAPFSAEYWTNASGSPLAGTFTFGTADQYNCAAAAFKATGGTSAGSAYSNSGGSALQIDRPPISGGNFTRLYG